MPAACRARPDKGAACSAKLVGFADEPRLDLGRLAALPLLIGTIDGKLLGLAFGFRNRGGKLPLLGSQRVALRDRGGQRSGARRLLLAQGRQGGGAIGVAGGRRRDLDHRLAHRPVSRGEGRARIGLAPDQRLPAQRQQHRFGAPHMFGQVAVSDGLPRLLLQPVELRPHGAQHILETFEIGLGGA